MAAFRARMGRAERWTRVVCTCLGALGLAATLVLLRVPREMSAHALALRLLPVLLMGLCSLAFLLRGLIGEDGESAFADIVRGLPSHRWLTRRK